MSQKIKDKADAAEAKTHETRSFTQQVRVVDKRKYTPEEKIRIVLAIVPKKKQDEVRKALHRIFYAACLDDTRDEAKKGLSRYSREFLTTCETLARHLEKCLTFYRFPARHWKHIRTSSVIEPAFKKVKRKTIVVGRFPYETSALVMFFSLLEEEGVK